MKLGIHTCYFTSNKIKPTYQCCTSAMTEYQTLFSKAKRSTCKMRSKPNFDQKTK